MPTRNPELLANASSSYPRSVMHQSIRWHGGKKLHSKIAPSGALREFQSPNPDPVGTDLCQIIAGLLRKPGCCAAAENLGKTHGHFGRYPALPIDKLRQRSTSHPEGISSLRYGQAQRLNALAAQSRQDVADSSSACSVSFSDNRCNQRLVLPRLRSRQLARTVTAQKPFS